MSGIGSGKNRTKSLVSKDTFFNNNAKRRGTSTMTTGFSTATDGNVTIDPSVRAIQEQGLGRINDLYGQTESYGNELIGNTRSLRNRFLGNQSDYANAQMNPLRQQVATRRGELQRNIGLRGISGSSFGDQSLNNFETESGRALQDASANVEMQQLQALTGIDAQMTQQMFGKIAKQQELNGESLEVAKTRLVGELQALGVGQAQINTMVQAFESQQNRAFQERKAIADTIVKGFGGSGGGGKIVCTAMNEAYGFGSYRNKIWIKYARDHLTEYHEIGYHAIFIPIVNYGFNSGSGVIKNIVRKTMEHIARHRSVYLRSYMKGKNQDILGHIYNSVLAPICYVVGRIKGK